MGLPVYNPTKEQLKEWKTCGCLSKTFLSTASAKKVIVGVFWVEGGFISLITLKSKKQITGEYYARLFDKFYDRETKVGFQMKVINFDQDYGTLGDLKFELLVRPPYSPNLAPSEYHLLSNLTLFLAAKSSGRNK